jgi:ClpP class serine protease
MRDTTDTTAEVGAVDRIRTAAADLARHRGGPCLLFVSGSLVHRDVLTIREAFGSAHGDHLDVIVASPGGRSEAAYLVTRELRRRFTSLTAYVPFQAKSAATLLCLAADELVLGDLGELGPLDTQYEEKQKADYPVNTSHLVPGVALRQLQHEVMELYDTVVTRIVKASGLRPFEAGSKAAELIASLYAPVLGQVSRVIQFSPGMVIENSPAVARLVMR